MHFPIVLLHGFLGRGTDWKPLLTHLPEWHHLTPDLPGHGDTPLRPGKQSYTAWLQWLAAYLDQRGISFAHLVGYSLGGRVALAFALAYPTRLASLTLVSANPGISDAQQRRQRALQDQERARRILRQGLSPFLEAWYRMPLFASLERYPGLRERLIAERSQQNPEAMARVIAEMSPGRQIDLTPHLHKITTPTLVVTGALDTTYTQRWKALIRRLPNGRLAVVPKAGHAVPSERPEALAQILRGFLLEQESQPG